MAAGGDVASWAGIRLLDIPRREDLLVLNDDAADRVAAVVARPYPRQDVVDGINDVAVSVICNGTMGALRGIPNDRDRRVDKEIEPVTGLLDSRTTFKPNSRLIFASGHGA